MQDLQLEMKEKFITKTTLSEAKKQEDLTDWSKIEQMSETEITENAKEDSENLPISYPPSAKLKRRIR